MSKRLLTFTVNERAQEHAVADNALLVDVLRDTLGLTGTKQGCDGVLLRALVDGEGQKSLAHACSSGRRRRRLLRLVSFSREAA